MESGLMGKTIAPAVANKFFNSVEFDGFGRIESFSKPLSHKKLMKLKAAVIEPLTETVATRNTTEPRTERDGLIVLLQALRKSHSSGAAELTQQARSLWLGGVVTRESMLSLIDQALPGVADDAELHSLLTELRAETVQLKTIPQYNENIYGRKFETALAQSLVENPPAGVLKAGAQMNRYMLRHVERLDPDTQDVVLATIAEYIQQDPRPWFGAKPEIVAFQQNPTINGLAELLRKPKDGLDVVKGGYIAHRVT